MNRVEIDETPAALIRLATEAARIGWDVTAMSADGPPTTIGLRFAHDGYRAYGVWALDDGRIAFRSAGCRSVPPGPLRTLAALKRYLGVTA